MSDTEGDGDVFDWTFELNPGAPNGSVRVFCRGPISQAQWFYGQIRSQGVFAASYGYPLNHLFPPGTFDLAITARRVDNGQTDQMAVENLITRLGAIKA